MAQRFRSKRRRKNLADRIASVCWAASGGNALFAIALGAELGLSRKEIQNGLSGMRAGQDAFATLGSRRRARAG